MKTLLLFCLLITANLFGSQDSIDLNDFESLMGKSTPHWNYVAKADDLQTLEFAKTIYQKNKDAQFAKEGAYKIPPTVHFIWLGPRAFPPESVENVRSWIALNPGWKVKFWTDRDRDPPCEGMETVFVKDFTFLKLGKQYEQSQNWGEKSDLLRYEILYREGGVYADHDANCLKSFSGMHRGYDFFCCLETPHRPFVGRNVTCGNGVIGSRPRHPTVGRVMDLISERWEPLGEKFRGNDEYSRVEVVMQRTYIALTNAVASTLDRDGNVDVIFPAAYFFSKSGIPSLYSQHFYAGAWDDFKVRKTLGDRAEERSLGKIRRKNRNLNLLIVGLIAFNSVIFGMILIKRRKKS
ncbi:MAG: hypothetical protein JSS60_07310 [Verrucomicrobia bacterium]|nr:hypothetical protein [Verrucomicrobiota bacterium]